MMYQNKLIISITVLAIGILSSSCSVIKKIEHPNQYCAEHRCYKKRQKESIYCEPHYKLQMFFMTQAAEKVKKENSEK